MPAYAERAASIRPLLPWLHAFLAAVFLNLLLPFYPTYLAWYALPLLAVFNLATRHLYTMLDMHQEAVGG